MGSLRLWNSLESCHMVDAVSIVGEYLKAEPWLKILYDHLGLEFVDPTIKETNTENLPNANENMMECSNSLQENSKEMELETEKADKQIATVSHVARHMVGDNSDTGQSVKEEVKKQFWLSAPLIGVSLLQYSLQVISVMFVGHLGSLPLSAASIATSFASVTGFTFLMGTASALETLCGQSYGAKMYGKLGIYMQRAMFVLLILSIPLSIIWSYTENILVYVHQDKSISKLAGSYAQYMIPSIFAYALLQCLNRFLQTQNNVFPVFVCSGITTCLHVLLCWVLVLKSGLGHKGAALAISVSYWLNVILLSCYVKFSASCSQTWTGFSIEALSHIPAFMKLGFPSAVMLRAMVVRASGTLVRSTS